MKVQAFQHQEALPFNGCLPGRWPLRAPSFTSVFLNAHPSVVFGIRDCCAVWRHRLMITRQLKHTYIWIHTKGKKTEDSKKGYTALVISSFRLRLMDRLSDTGQARTLQSWIKTQTLDRRWSSAAGNRIIVNSRASLNPAWHCLSSESPPNSDEPLRSSFHIQRQFMQPKLILLWYSFSVLKCGLFKDKQMVLFLVR